MRRLVPLALAAAVALACGEGGGEVGAASRPSLLLVSVDTLRADRTTAYGYEQRETTPELERLAGEGARVLRAYAPSATTSPSHASLFTGTHPLAHGVRKNGIPLAAEHRTLAERLAAEGYDTAGIASSYVLSERFGFSQGFARYEDDFPAEGASVSDVVWEGFEVEEGFDRRADAATDRAIRFLEEGREPGRPFFLFVHYFDPHSPYVPPEGLARRFGVGGVPKRSVEAFRRRYDAEVAFADREIGRLLSAVERLGLRRRTLVVFVADHGEGLMDHGHMAHGVHLYEEQVRVPLVWRLPGRIGAGTRLEGPATLQDVAPTALELLGVSAEGADFGGRSLAGALLGGAPPPPPERPVLLFRRPYEPGRVGRLRVAGEGFGLVRGRWKYIEVPEEGRRELYDLERDPGEKEDRRAEAPEVAARMAERLRALVRERGREDAPLPELPEGVRRRLEALGYVE